MPVIDLVEWLNEGSEPVYAWKFREPNLSTYTQLIVRESQEAILFSKGRLIGQFGPGKYTLDTEKMKNDTGGGLASENPNEVDDSRACRLIEGARQGDPDAINELISLIYPELKRRARWLMAAERSGHTFGPSGSELVQRAMERVLAAGGELFHAADTEEELIKMLTRRMRFILVDYARAAKAVRRPGPNSRVSFDDAQRATPATEIKIDQVLSVDEVLTILARQDPDAARCLELRFFAGLTNEEAAGAMGWSVASFRRTLKRATAFCKVVLESAANPSEGSVLPDMG